MLLYANVKNIWKLERWEISKPSDNSIKQADHWNKDSSPDFFRSKLWKLIQNSESNFCILFIFWLQPDQMSWNSEHELKLSEWADLITFAGEEENPSAPDTMSKVKMNFEVGKVSVSVILDQMKFNTCSCSDYLDPCKIHPTSLKPWE